MWTRFCCMRLKTAGIAIGSLNAFFSLLIIALTSYGLADIDQVVQWIIASKDHASVTDVSMLIQAFTALFATLLVYFIVQHITAILLLLGSVKTQNRLMLPWLLLCAFSVIVLVLFCFYIVLMAVVAATPLGIVLFLFAIGSVNLVFQIFCWLAIYSLYKENQAQRKVQSTSAYSNF